MASTSTFTDHPWLRALARRLLRPAAGEGAAPGPVCLPPGSLWSGRLRGPPRVFRCSEGQVWLTLEGDPEDHVLGPGESLCLEAGLVVVQALRSSRFCLSPCTTEQKRGPRLSASAV